MKSGELKKIECSRKLVEAIFLPGKIERRNKEKIRFVSIATIATSDLTGNNNILLSIAITLFIYSYISTIVLLKESCID